MLGLFGRLMLLFTSHPETGTTDETKLKELKDFVQNYLNEHGHYPLLTLEQFFDGNHDLGSMGANLWRHPGIPRFYGILQEIRARDDVSDVWIRLNDDSVEDDDDMWIFTDMVLIITSAHPNSIRKDIMPLHPDEIGIDPIDVQTDMDKLGNFTTKNIPLDTIHPELKDIPANQSILYAWWD